MIKELYFKKHPIYTIRGLSKKLNYSERSIYRLKKEFLNDIAKKLNIYDP